MKIIQKNIGKNIELIINSIDIPYYCFSYYIATGMKDDWKYTSGLAHLTEHVIIENFIEKYKDIDENAIINAFVDKEYTCFYGKVLRKNLNRFIETFPMLVVDSLNHISNEIIEVQKEIIYNIENARVLSNERLLNILQLEQNIFCSDLKYPTIIDNYEKFTNIKKEQIIDFVKNEYLNAKHYIIISGSDINSSIITSNFNNIKSIYSKRNSKKNERIDLNADLNVKLEDINNIGNNIVCIPIIKFKTLEEYFACNVLIKMYKTHIYDKLKGSEKYIEDVSFKVYNNSVLLFFSYSIYDIKTLVYLKDFDINDQLELLETMKKHSIFNYLNKITNIEIYNKEIFKCIYYFNQLLSHEQVISLYKGIDRKIITELHTSVINSRLIYINGENI